MFQWRDECRGRIWVPKWSARRLITNNPETITKFPKRSLTIRVQRVGSSSADRIEVWVVEDPSDQATPSTRELRVCPRTNAELNYIKGSINRVEERRGASEDRGRGAGRSPCEREPHDPATPHPSHWPAGYYAPPSLSHRACRASLPLTRAFFSRATKTRSDDDSQVSYDVTWTVTLFGGANSCGGPVTRAEDRSREVSECGARWCYSDLLCLWKDKDLDQSARQVCCVCSLTVIPHGRSVLWLDLTDKSDSTDPVFNEKTPRGPVILGVSSHLLSSRLGSWPRAPRQPAFLSPQVVTVSQLFSPPAHPLCCPWK